MLAAAAMGAEGLTAASLFTKPSELKFGAKVLRRVARSPAPTIRMPSLLRWLGGIANAEASARSCRCQATRSSPIVHSPCGPSCRRSPLPLCARNARHAVQGGGGFEILCVCEMFGVCDFRMFGMCDFLEDDMCGEFVGFFIYSNF